MIGYYVHHRGAGHVTRAAAIARRVDEAVTGLSSRPRPRDWEGDWVRLARDDAPPPLAGADPPAGGALHWAPAGHAGLRQRMAELARWLDAARPRLIVVDVSVEVAAFARLMGVPVALVALPGRRTDDAHTLAFRIASVIVAAWPDWASPMTAAEPWSAKLHPVGALSRFDGRSPSPPPSADASGRRRRVLVLGGSGGSALTPGQVAEAAGATHGWDWRTLGGPGGWEPDPWPALASADVVVTHAGQNALAEVAAARRPAIVIPERRPYEEQHCTARELGKAGLALVEPRWPHPDRWPRLLEKAVRRGGDGWVRWNDGRGADRAARVLASPAESAREALASAPL
jgi:Glycosyltransferase family 28 C-terminal domain